MSDPVMTSSLPSPWPSLFDAGLQNAPPHVVAEGLDWVVRFCVTACHLGRGCTIQEIADHWGLSPLVVEMSEKAYEQAFGNVATEFGETVIDEALQLESFEMGDLEGGAHRLAQWVWR